MQIIIIMKKMFKLLFIVIGVLTFSSCAVHNGYMNNSASLSQANFDYTQVSISGTASTTQVFGIGGLGKSAIVDEAKKDMLKKNPLKSNQALVNITVNWKSGFYLIVMTKTCTVAADVVEFNSGIKSDAVELNGENGKTQTNPVVTEKKIMQEKNKTEASFKVGDKVVYQGSFKKIEGTIYKVEGENYYIKYTDKNGQEKTRKTTSVWLKRYE